jgi:hypothetical protein
MNSREQSKLETGAKLALEAVADLCEWGTAYLQKVERIGVESERLLLDDNYVDATTPPGIGPGRIFWLPRYHVIFAVARQDKKDFRLGKGRELPERVAWFGVAYRLTERWSPMLISGGFSALKTKGVSPKNYSPRNLLGGLVESRFKKDCSEGRSGEEESLFLTANYRIILCQSLLGVTAAEEQLDEVASETVERMVKWAFQA